MDDAITRLMALDVGKKTIGIAMSDPLGITAQPFTTIRRGATAADLAEIRRLAALYSVSAIVVGYPRNMNGSVGPQARFVEQFSDQLRSGLDIPVVYEDERLSTRIAEQAMRDGGLRSAKRREIIDQQAAAVILQGYMDRQRRNRPPAQDDDDTGER